MLPNFLNKLAYGDLGKLVEEARQGRTPEMNQQLVRRVRSEGIS